jgi:L-aspartate oxidase
MGYPLLPMHPDYVVVGAGVAGLRAAIELARGGQVLVIAKDSLRESSSEYAQGGIAAALSDDDEVALHEHDTLLAGDGLCDPEAVRILVEHGPEAIEELIGWGAEFDRDGSKLAFAREGAHSRSRVLHAHGDSTGHEIARTLYRKAASLPQVSFRSYASVSDLCVAGQEVTGVVVQDGAERIAIPARAVLLATGGLGQIYRDTTNPPVATGDGVAIAWRAGAVVSDIEFVQFHPTALHVEGAPSFLLSEALRGEGAYLRNSAGERFMSRYHEMGELAPRDVVSRAIFAEMQGTGAPHVFLDLTHLGPGRVQSRFPRIYETCLKYGVDLARQPAPIHPAAHYAMGGVRTDLDGRTNLSRLYAAGEVACAGVHGANRLASNSLLEGCVFGARAGKSMLAWSGNPGHAALTAASVELGPDDRARTIASQHCGIIRSAEGLRRAIAEVQALPPTNMSTVAGLIARCALAREESRGGHYRSDYPHKRPEFAVHSNVRLDRDVWFA